MPYQRPSSNSTVLLPLPEHFKKLCSSRLEKEFLERAWSGIQRQVQLGARASGQQKHPSAFQFDIATNAGIEFDVVTIGGCRASKEGSEDASRSLNFARVYLLIRFFDHYPTLVQAAGIRVTKDVVGILDTEYDLYKGICSEQGSWDEVNHCDDNGAPVYTPRCVPNN